MTTTLETDGDDQLLDFRVVFHLIIRISGSKTRSNKDLRLDVRLSVLLLRVLDLPTNNILSDIVFLRQVEEPPDLGYPLGPETLGEDVGISFSPCLTMKTERASNVATVGKLISTF